MTTDAKGTREWWSDEVRQDWERQHRRHSERQQLRASRRKADDSVEIEPKTYFV